VGDAKVVYVTFPDVCKGSVCNILQMAIDILQRF